MLTQRLKVDITITVSTCSNSNIRVEERMWYACTIFYALRVVI